MDNAKKRADRWKVKYTPERVAETIGALHGQMTANYEAAMAQVVAMELKVKEVLNICGVHTSNYVPYLNFGRQLYKLSRQQNISGESFAMAAKVLKDKWAARGCNPEFLDTIRLKVFNIKEPEA